jgi:hypothetical protein
VTCPLTLSPNQMEASDDGSHSFESVAPATHCTTVALVSHTSPEARTVTTCAWP